MLINYLYFILPELIIASCICLLILINSLAKSLRQYSGVLIGSAAMIACIPIAHLHGGETTEGAFDEAIRHSITKMSHFHFVAAKEYKNSIKYI